MNRPRVCRGRVRLAVVPHLIREFTTAADRPDLPSCLSRSRRRRAELRPGGPQRQLFFIFDGPLGAHRRQQENEHGPGQHGEERGDCQLSINVYSILVGLK
jgi:hypothetical protein